MSFRARALLFLAAALGAAPPQLVLSVPEGADLAIPGVPSAAEVWLAMVAQATTRLDFAQFYLANRPGSALDRVLAALEAAGRRGVKVRFLLSARGPESDAATLARIRAIPGAEVRHLDLPDRKGVLHAKYFLVDGRELFVGSQNFDWRALAHIHETGVRLDAPGAVARLAAVFEADWARAGKAKPPKAALPPLQPGEPEVLASPADLNPPGVRATLPVLLELLTQARTRIRLQVLTYSPVSGGEAHWPVLDNALRAAAVRGVKVELLVSDWNLEAPALHHLRSLAALPHVEVRVAAIPEDPGGFIPFARVIHSKLLRVDVDTLVVGTSNGSASYFTASRNVEVLFHDAALAAQADQISDRIWNSPHAFRLEPGGAYAPRRRE